MKNLDKLIDDAQTRGERRKSKWNLLLIPLVISTLAFLYYFSFQVIGDLHNHFHPGQDFQTTPKGIGAILSAISPFVASLPIAMIISNAIIWLIPPARIALENESKTIGSSYSKMQKQLIISALIICPVSWGVGIYGAYLPWHS